MLPTNLIVDLLVVIFALVVLLLVKDALVFNASDATAAKLLIFNRQPHKPIKVVFVHCERKPALHNVSNNLAGLVCVTVATANIRLGRLIVQRWANGLNVGIEDVIAIAA
jgi:hypothetical protein